MKERNVIKVQYPLGYSCRGFRIMIGTPAEIVDRMFKDRSPFLKVKTKNEYMKRIVRRVEMVGIDEVGNYLTGRTLEDRCQTFFKIMLKSGYIKELPLKRR